MQSVVCSFERGLEAVLQEASKNAELGLLVGRLGMPLTVLEMIATPEEEDGNGGTQPVVKRMEESLLDHGCCLNRILPGGLYVVGVYISTNERGRPGVLDALKRCLRKISEDRNAANDSLERLVVTLEGDGRRTANLISVQRDSNIKERACNIQFSDLKQWMHVCCKYSLNMGIPVSETNPSFRDVRKHILSSEAAVVGDALAVLDSGELVENQTVQDVARNDVVHVSLCAPFGKQKPVEDMTVGSYLTAKGVLDCRAVCRPEDSLQDVIEHLKMDVRYTIRTRLHILKEDIEETEENAVLPLSKIQTLPRRVWGAWKFGIQLCEYLTDEETISDAIHNIEELIPVTLPQMEGKEAAPQIAGQLLKWDPFLPKSKASFASTIKGRLPAVHWLNVLVAVLATILGIVYYYVTKAYQDRLQNLQ